jgi:hypothetical protein
MKKLVLNENESNELKRYGVVEIERNGFYIFVQSNRYFDETKDDESQRYDIVIINHFDKVIVK